jgi:hypothetical protein
MFEEDQPGDVLVAPGPAPGLFPDPIPDLLPPDSIDLVTVDVEEIGQVKTVKTLREMLYAAEPWPYDNPPTPAIGRLMEKRVNRNLTLVADWMLAVVEERQGDEMTLVVLLELAELVRKQITWSVRDSHEAKVAGSR